MNKRIFVILSFIILFLSLLDIKTIPFYNKLGLDFSNQYGFHHCADTPESLYKKPGVKCQDFEERPYVYPPLLYQMFSWTRLFDNVTSAYYFFVFLYILSFVGMIYVWSEKNLMSLFFSAGLILTFPSLFLLERGNSDMFVVFLWSGAYWCYQKEKMNWASFLVVVSVAAKLYPIYAFIVVVPLFLRKISKHPYIYKAFILSSLFVVLLSPLLWFEYVIDVLPKWSKASTPVYNLAHSFKSIPLPALGAGLFFIGFIFWILAGHKSSDKKSKWAWAGGLAISTFNNGVSFDYNLVTLFPLAIVAFDDLSKKENKCVQVYFLILFFVTFGSRQLFVNVSFYPLLRLFVLGFIISAIPFLLFDLKHDFKRLYARLKFSLKEIFTLM